MASVAQNPASKLSYELQRLLPGFIPIQTEGDQMVFDQIMYDAKGNVVVRLLAKTGSEVLVNELRAKNFDIIVTTKFTVTISVPVSRLKELENVEEMRKATAEYKPGHGAVVSQGDTAMKSHLARVTYGVNGAGVKVGVLSDSYNNLGGAAAGVTNGELPGPGNPNGFTNPVEVLAELSSGGSDEGRAMIEIVHDVAPGATKAFATAFVGGQAGFANNIIALKDAGSKVIVDDVFYFAEPFFQNGFIAQAVNTVKAAGVTYFSLAGNHARAAYANSFRAGSFTFPGVTAGNVAAHNFAAPGDPDVYMLQITGLAAATYTVVLQWDEPFPSVSGGAGAQTDMDIFWYDATGTVPVVSPPVNNIGLDPIEQLRINTSGGTRNLAIRHTSGPAPQNLRIVIYTNGLPLTFGNAAVPGINASTLVGHPNTPGAISVGAAPWFRTPAYGVNPPVIEAFSSLGGTPILFDDDGNRLPVPIIYDKPEITGPDGGNTSFFGREIPEDTDTFRNFFGTSASGPHAAAVAALMIQSRNGQSPLTPDQIKTVMENSTIDMDDPDIAGFQTGFDYRTGHGLLQADLALAQVNCTTPITLTTGTVLNICQGTKSFTIPYTATTGSPISYSISGPGITSVNDVVLAAAPSSITVNLSGGATLPSIAYNLQLKNANGCLSDTIKGTVTIDPASIINAGPDQTVCDSDTIYLSATLSGVATQMVWQKNAAFGTFVGPDTSPNAKFVLNAAGKMLDSLSFGAMSNDPGGNVCQGGLDTVKIYIEHGAASVEAGPDQTVCSSSPTVTLAGSKGGTATVATWSGGAGIFTPNNTTLNATYTPTPGEITAGSVKLKLTTDDPDGICKAAVDSVIITYDPASIINAGPDQTVCDSDTIYLSATLSGLATQMVWQKNVAFGTFIGPDTSPNAKFVLNAAGKMLDSLSFGAMSNDPGGNVCQGGLDTVKIYIEHGAASVEAGADQTVCSSSPTVTLAGSKGGTATVATWSGGAGIFTPNNTTLNATYTPTPGEITAGSVKLKLTTDDPDGICKAAVDSVIITYDPASIINAGPDQTVCDSDTIYLSATLSGVATQMVWQKNAAFGTFVGPDTSPNAKFVLNAAGKMLDSLSFGAMSNDPGGNVCQGGLDTVKIYIEHGAASVEAGADQTVCSSSPTVTLAGSKGGTATVATWSGGAGIFTPNNTTLNATYTPTPGEITAGSVKLKLTTDDPDGICKAAVDSVIITYDPASIVNAGPDQAVCSMDTIYLSATLSGVATQMVWQKNVAFGTFVGPDTSPNAKFVLNAAGKMLDSLSFGAMSNDPGGNVCQGGLDTVKIYILHPAVPLVAAGDTINAGSSINLTGTGCTGPGFTLRWFQAADDAPVSMPVSPLQTTTYYARCEQTRLGVTCQSDKSTEFIVTVLPSSTSIIYVNVANNAPGQDGSSWSKAFASLQQGLTAAAALQASASTVQVWVAQGTYKPGTLRKDVFSIPSGVKVFGGFVGTETLLEERNWKINLTILSGEIGTIVPDDNTYHVVLFKATNDTTQLDGFQVVRGFAEFFAGNQTNNLEDPSVQASGGGILAIEKSKGLIINCTVTDNRAIGGGGMLLRDSSHLHIIQSVIFGNEATFGGGVYVLGGSQPYFENVLFAINKGLGAGLYVNHSQPTLMNCTIASNKDGSNNVGGVYNSNATTTIQNSILWGNTPLQSTAGSNITNSIVEGGYMGTGNLNLNPLFVNPNPTGLAPMGVLGDYHLQICSPAINSGNNAGAPNVDLDGNARPFPIGIGIADMGVYESQSAGSSGPPNLTVTEPITSGTVLKVAGKITATNQISGAKVVYQATNSVILSPGFSATGNSFLAVIGDCSTPVPASAGSEESLNQK
ncbi:hypothetical protein DVG78_02235 [Runella aurantiaca]|uniref:Right handed beta helix domain-containing protein n=1 Tax=Runella aurantiaca TaxID=2282308 RepID=A0A369IKZ3_9BACT|nr:hypothetical protein DVG78_02235 [Runella aurantiaca]